MVKFGSLIFLKQCSAGYNISVGIFRQEFLQRIQQNKTAYLYIHTYGKTLFGPFGPLFSCGGFSIRKKNFLENHQTLKFDFNNWFDRRRLKCKRLWTTTMTWTTRRRRTITLTHITLWVWVKWVQNLIMKSARPIQ